jgi:hypothetical protein
MSTPRTRTAIKKQCETLWDGEAGTTCPVFPFYRHPVFRRLKSICYTWMPALFALSLIVRLFDLAAWLLSVYLAFLLAVVGLLWVVTQHGKLCGAARGVQRRLHGWRFLCPTCLQFGPERFACGVCGAEVEEFVLLTHGLYLNNCPACGIKVFSDDTHSARSRCAHCKERCDGKHHQRQVRVFGVLEGASFQRLRQWPLVTQHARDSAYLRGDDGRQLTYVLDFGKPSGTEDGFGAPHAVRAVEALWLGEPWGDPLVLAQALDRFIRRARLSPEVRHSLPVWVCDARWDPLSRNVLEARFRDVQYGVTAEEFLARSTGTPVSRSPEPSFEPR